jgi:hypothetical protein
MIDYLSADKEFNMLSLLDLMEARDLYHVHLMHKANVVATAVGRYLIRHNDPWPTSLGDVKAIAEQDKQQIKEARTLQNSEVRPYSWPCILVFVDTWVDRDKFGDEEHDEVSASDMVPKAIYMPDGRVVPVCVVKATLVEGAPDAGGDVTFPDNLIGGGYPVIADVQGQQHVASIGCMVTDGHLVYALTNRHVSGAPGETVYTMLDGEYVEIGKSSEKQLRRMPFQDVYAGWPGKNVYVNLDIGLIEITDRGRWTAQVYDIGQMGKLADLSINNISLKLIDCPVRAFGCASKQMFGQIYALFYRYKSVGGFEYVADFLIGRRRVKSAEDARGEVAEARPDEELPFAVNPGDSGTLWLLDTGDQKAGLMPLAVLWGGHSFVDGTNPNQSRADYALATCLSTVCNMLDVDVVRDWNIGHPERWGEMGHYTIGAKACGLVKNPNLRKLITANLKNIGFDDGLLKAGKYKHKSDPDPLHPAFVPLADVADNIWRVDRHKAGEPDKKPFSRKEDENNHFADMDQPGHLEGHDGETLLRICKDTKNVDPGVWLNFYDSFKGHHEGRINPGALPFRVWQIYDKMVEFVRKGNVTSFVCAAGILAHYVGDACQPLHVSHLHHGSPLPDDDEDVAKIKKEVHEVYETVMLDHYRSKGLGGEQDQARGLVDGINDALSGKKAKADVVGGHDAAVKVVRLMGETVETLPPQSIVNAYPLEGTQGERATALWKRFKHETISCMAAGCLRLASLWESAWKEGNGDKNVDAGNLAEVKQKELQKLYQNPNFLPSKPLKEMKDMLQ